MRTLIVLDSSKPEFVFFNIVKFWIQSGHETGIYDISHAPSDELKLYLGNEIYPFSTLTEAIVEYYEAALCAYSALPFIRGLNIYIFSYYYNSRHKDIINKGADFLFISKGRCICDSAYMNIGQPRPEECTGLPDTLETTSEFYEAIRHTLEFLSKTMLENMEYPTCRKYHLQELFEGAEIIPYSSLTMEELLKKRTEHYIRKINRVDCLTDVLDIQPYLNALHEIVSNSHLSVNKILEQEKIVLYMLLKEHLHQIKKSEQLDIIYLNYLRNNLHDSVEKIADQNACDSCNYYYVKGICAFHRADYDTCTSFFNKYFKKLQIETLSSNHNEIQSFFETAKYTKKAATYYYRSMIETDLEHIDIEKFSEFLKNISNRERKNFYRRIINKSREYLHQDRLEECLTACIVYDNLIQTAGSDANYSRNRYWYFRNLKQIHKQSKHRIVSLKYGILSLLYALRLIAVKIKNKLRMPGLRKKAVKFSFRCKKYLKRKFKELCALLHIYGSNERRLLKYHNKYYGKRCFVIGNGPSLRIEDLDMLKSNGDYCFACNKIYKVFGKTSWRPNFYACTDSAVFRQNYYSILKQKEYQKFFGANLPLQDKIRQDPDNIRINYATKRIERTRFNPKATFIYSGGTVTYVLITLAWLMGFREIYLIGCDHSYGFFSGKKSGSMESTAETNNDYFMKNYMRPGEKINVGNLDRSEQGYIIARNYIESHGGKIFNATRGGKLEVFPRADLDEVLNHKPL